MAVVYADPIFVRVYVYNNGDGPPVDPEDPEEPAEDTFEGTFLLTSPQDQAVSASATPTFVVAVVPEDPNDTTEYTVQIQYADNTAFTNPVTLSATAEASDGGVEVTPASPVPATTSWRARLLVDGEQVHGWTERNTFTLLTSIAASTVPVSWTVSPATDRPIHLWHFDPPGPDAGDTVVVYGQGFPATGTLSFGDDFLPVQSWTLIPATAANNSADRIIDGATVTCEHHEVSFVAPAYDGPGDALVVEG